MKLQLVKEVQTVSILLQLGYRVCTSFQGNCGSERNKPPFAKARLWSECKREGKTRDHRSFTQSGDEWKRGANVEELKRRSLQVVTRTKDIRFQLFALDAFVSLLITSLINTLLVSSRPVTFLNSNK